ncbi:alpha/beta-hydrolase [Auricularia subglabra TFB-10046 SS5]|nr:alpha/beta-hydrolase [Auricularia subglabra TFB-10046 SS5]
MSRLALALLLAGATSASILDPEFDPAAFPRRVAKCSALNRETNKTATIDIHYVDANPSAERTLLFVHGWPGLWTNWANQIHAFKDQYRLLVPDQRGFGRSTHPGDEQSSGQMRDLADDLVCVLKHAGVAGKAVCVGHDWGSQVCLETIRMHPDAVAAAAGTIPVRPRRSFLRAAHSILTRRQYIPAVGAYVPMAALAKHMKHLTYQLYFERQTVIAALELAKSPRRTLRAVYRDIAHPPPAGFLTSDDDFLGAYDGMDLDDRIPYLSQKEEDYLVDAYENSGFEKTLQFYTRGNRQGGHEYASKTGRKIIDEPIALIYPDADPVVKAEQAMELLHTRDFLPNLSTYSVHAAHWPQLENPQAYNDALKKWLDSLPNKKAENEKPAAPLAEEPIFEPLLHEEL